MHLKKAAFSEIYGVWGIILDYDKMRITWQEGKNPARMKVCLCAKEREDSVTEDYSEKNSSTISEA